MQTLRKILKGYAILAAFLSPLGIVAYLCSIAAPKIGREDVGNAIAILVAIGVLTVVAFNLGDDPRKPDPYDGIGG